MELHGPPFQRPFTTVSGLFLKGLSCTDLHFRGLSQLVGMREDWNWTLHGPPFQRPFTTLEGCSCEGRGLHGPPFQRPFTTPSVQDFSFGEVARTSISEAFHNDVLRHSERHTSCTDLHFRGLSQPIRFISPSSPFIYWGFVTI